VELATRAREAYVAGAFRQAVDLYKQAYEQRQDPTILFNLARCYEALGGRADLSAAIDAYAGYLAATPSAPDRAAIERRVEVLQQQIRTMDESAAAAAAASASAAATEPPAPVAPDPREAPPPDARPRAVARLPWLVAGVGALGLGAGGAFALLARQRHGEAVDEPSASKAHEHEDASRSLATGANVGFVAGGLLTAVGVTWGLWDLWGRGPSPAGTADRSAAAVSVRVGPAALSIAGSF
jgi:tetratricopeptide (TPR) repeat protein